MNIIYIFVCHSTLDDVSHKDKIMRIDFRHYFPINSHNNIYHNNNKCSYVRLPISFIPLFSLLSTKNRREYCRLEISITKLLNRSGSGKIYICQKSDVIRRMISMSMTESKLFIFLISSRLYYHAAAIINRANASPHCPYLQLKNRICLLVISFC